MTARRQRLMQMAKDEKARNAAGVTEQQMADMANQVTVGYSKHFMIEVAENEDGEVFAIYRLADLISNSFADGAGVDPIGPVHEADSMANALSICGVLDKLVDAMEGDDAKSVTVVEDVVN